MIRPLKNSCMNSHMLQHLSQAKESNRNVDLKVQEVRRHENNGAFGHIICRLRAVDKLELFTSK